MYYHIRVFFNLWAGATIVSCFVLCLELLVKRYYSLRSSAEHQNFWTVGVSTVKGTLQAKQKSLCFSLDSDEILHTLVKLKINWGNRNVFFFSILSLENKLFTENVKKGPCGNEQNGRTVQLTQLIIISIEVEFRAQQNYRVFFRMSF